MAKSNTAGLKEQAQKYSQQGKRLQAAETYQKLFLEDPTNPRWPQKAGEEFRTIGQKSKAIASFFEAAKLYAHQGFTLKAITLCKLVLDLDGANQPAQKMLASFSAPAPQAPPPPALPVPARPSASPPRPESPGLIELMEFGETDIQAQPAAPRRQFQEIEVPELPDLLEVHDLPETMVAPPPPPAPGIFGVPDLFEVPDLPDRSPLQAAPGAPEEPGAPLMFDVPDVPDLPETPPETASSSAPEWLEATSFPETPDLPEPPAAPEVLEPPDQPEAPELPEPPAEPEAPELPETPGMLELPVEPGMSESPGALAAPTVPDELGVSDIFGEPGETAQEPVPPAAAPGGFVIQPGDTLLASDLSRAMAPPVPKVKFDVDAFEIVIDEPEVVETAIEPSVLGSAAAVPKDHILTRMPPVPIFSSLGPAALKALVERAEVRTFAPGARLITQGEAGNALFVLVEGEVAVFHEGPPRVELTRLKEGAFFGEIALITKAPRNASVEAVRECLVLEISREVFNELIQTHPDMVKVVLRFLRERLVNGLVETHPLFAPFAGAEKTQLIRRFSLLEAPGGCVLVQEGAHANGLYIILCGEAESRRGGELAATLTSGGIFGVESLLMGQPSQVTVKTLNKCWILKMREDVFREVILTFSPVLSTLSDMIEQQSKKAEEASGSGLLEQLGIPLF